MNERIQKLYNQSLIRETVKDSNGNPMLAIKQNPEKFAELIVNECLELTLGKDRKQLLGKGDLNGANLVQKDIIRVIKHFGVGE
jgi:hypothetical protein